MSAGEGIELRQHPEETEVPLHPHWRRIFNKYDLNNDGRISLTELKNIIRSASYERDIPDVAVKEILRKADQDQNGYLEWDEFVRLVHMKEYRSLFAAVLGKYIRATVVPRHRLYEVDVVDGTGEYEEQYSCWPPAVAMIFISIVEVITFLWDVIAVGTMAANGPAATALMYNPHKRYEAWRYITYMFVHVGAFHLVVNLLVQILLGIPLEMVHRGWRVLIVYFAGVVAGSLGTSISDPNVYLAGASGGVYAIITAHVATIIMNWSEMKLAILQALVFFILAASDIGSAIYNRYVLKEATQIGYAAHIAGAIAGLLVGVNILRNLQVKPWEKVLRWTCFVLYFILMIGAIIWNAAFPDYFPVSYYRN
ncbi:rhomboid-related protein 2-like [Schistocerca cancellata]|uniref:rhomboid-related protein 2-like n=1 Tax=Schistocerca cancellata TaxID=274614 RepID=UPI002118CE86|nr:rhomboid-related protein 2-like [Schistocerca cancellata]XP_049767357.1 rhomboid-related protein 2-like [Schistocerca cancellata]